MINFCLGLAAVGDDLRLLVCYFLVLVQSNCWLLGPSELDLVALCIVLLLVEPAEGINVAWPRNSRELAFTGPCKFKFALNLLDDLFLERE